MGKSESKLTWPRCPARTKHDPLSERTRRLVTTAPGAATWGTALPLVRIVSAAPWYWAAIGHLLGVGVLGPAGDEADVVDRGEARVAAGLPQAGQCWHQQCEQGPPVTEVIRCFLLCVNLSRYCIKPHYWYLIHVITPHLQRLLNNNTHIVQVKVHKFIFNDQFNLQLWQCSNIS